MLIMVITLFLLSCVTVRVLNSMVKRVADTVHGCTAQLSTVKRQGTYVTVIMSCLLCSEWDTMVWIR